MPLIVGAGGVRLEAAGGRGCPRRGALVGVHGGGLLQVRQRSECEGVGWRAGRRVEVDYRCGGNRRVLMVAITSAARVRLGWRRSESSLRRRVHAGRLWAQWRGSGASSGNSHDVQGVDSEVVVVPEAGGDKIEHRSDAGGWRLAASRCSSAQQGRRAEWVVRAQSSRRGGDDGAARWLGDSQRGLGGMGRRSSHERGADDAG
jgi:hypothetical protein